MGRRRYVADTDIPGLCQQGDLFIYDPERGRVLHARYLSPGQKARFLVNRSLLTSLPRTVPQPRPSSARGRPDLRIVDGRT